MTDDLTLCLTRLLEAKQDWPGIMRRDFETVLAARDAEITRLRRKVDRSVTLGELDRALREADAPEDSMATEEDLIRYEGRAEAVQIMRDMLELDTQ
jgi:hypothetical protein